MKKKLARLGEHIDALSIRERGLVLLAIVAVLFLMWDTFLMTPLQQDNERIEAEIAAKRTTIQRLAEALQVATQKEGENPNVRLQREREELRERITELDARLAEETANIISPRRMATVLQDVLRRQRNLELVEIRSLAPQAILDVATDEAGLPGNVYRHGIVMEIEGSYLDLLAYLREIEAMPYSFIWDGLEIETTRYPQNRIVIRVYSLSLSEGLIGA